MNDDEKILAFIEEAQKLDRKGDAVGARERYLAALEFINHAHRKLLANFCRAMLPFHLKDHAEDIVHEIFLSVLAYMPQWKTGQTVHVTLIGVARRRTLDFLRKHNTQKSSIRRFFSWRHVKPSERHRSMHIRLEEVDLSNRSIEQLDVAEKQILHLYYIVGVPIEEMEAILGVPPDSIMRRIRRIREKLEDMRRRLEEG